MLRVTMTPSCLSIPCFAFFPARPPDAPGRARTASDPATAVAAAQVRAPNAVRADLAMASSSIKRTTTGIALAAAALLCWCAPTDAEEIGRVNTNFRITGSDRVVVEAYDDPAVNGVTCYVSRARTGGVKGTLGVAEDPTETSIACRQVAALQFKVPLPLQADIFSERISLIFKTLHVVRVVDRKRNALVYLTYSDRVVSGSAKNSVTAVPVQGQSIPLR
ncbi:CreA protein [Mycetohabitans rhizoxinica HKI 454]|uniref:CreA protein n=1 Tax=Mycetohabitans rhizoxinica (strain DSM 19002 / CIP 109453 / HKI 454) TaxID=882378 RepID=E5ANU4_MYCRK|nr:CreA protein [Mycetohabitans rhizoxinica HKI 454]